MALKAPTRTVIFNKECREGESDGCNLMRDSERG